MGGSTKTVYQEARIEPDKSAEIKTMDQFYLEQENYLDELQRNEEAITQGKQSEHQMFIDSTELNAKEKYEAKEREVRQKRGKRDLLWDTERGK